ncbi:serine hydrolase domain-containing protein [uncultured Shimia sp.]|uniref:serine hydrolase domain-containing protein n=1 Tax=uncultured Shimia sp. TaxID=573152 RepID=UPI0026212BD8|nr:serine hydrolase domain-containing protein [uncultured Shimia sp.]
MRRMLMVRSRHVLELTESPRGDLEDRVDGLKSLVDNTAFSALTCIKKNRIVYERCASDFSTRQPHSIQSVTKLHIHLIVGRLVSQGLLDLDKPVQHYLPDIGSGYSNAPIQSLLDMAVDNDFSEDYSDPLSDCYAEEIALGWRLPPEGEAEISLADFAGSITGYRPETHLGEIAYKSANTDVLTMICQVVCPRPLCVEIEAIADAVGYEGTFYISKSADQHPAFSGGACLSSRDLARFGLLFARYGHDVHGEPFANADFLQKTLLRRALPMSPPKNWLRYSNHTMTDGRMVGHAGYGGQFLMVDTQTEVSCAFLSVLENEEGYDDSYMAQVAETLKELCLAVG